MNLKKIGGKSFLVNLLSDFILSKIPIEENSIIRVIDCDNFYIIKGKTSHKEILNLSEIISEFKEIYQNLITDKKLSHTIDLIEYDVEMKNVEKINITFFNNEFNCSYSGYDVKNFERIEDDNNLVFVSDFPHGHSLSQGRGMFYYGKHIFYNIPNNYPIYNLKFELFRDDREEKIIVRDQFNEEDKVLQSAILDVFDFNYEKIENEMKKVDWSIELTNPLSEYDLLKEKVKGFIII